jgi:hypothetical protein
VIARRENPAATLSEAGDSLAVTGAQPVASIKRKKPEFIEVTRIKATQDGVVAFAVLCSVSDHDFARGLSAFIGN